MFLKCYSYVLQNILDKHAHNSFDNIHITVPKNVAQT